VAFRLCCSTFYHLTAYVTYAILIDLNHKAKPTHQLTWLDNRLDSLRTLILLYRLYYVMPQSRVDSSAMSKRATSFLTANARPFALRQTRDDHRQMRDPLPLRKRTTFCLCANARPFAFAQMQEHLPLELKLNATIPWFLPQPG
jgi:hypothetical protein